VVGGVAVSDCVGIADDVPEGEPDADVESDRTVAEATAGSLPS
jgi:hypothetical protein